MSEVTLTVGGATVSSERFTGHVRWLAEMGTTTHPPKLQQCVEVTKYGHCGHTTEQTYEWHDVPTEYAKEGGN